MQAAHNRAHIASYYWRTAGEQDIVHILLHVWSLAVTIDITSHNNKCININHLFVATILSELLCQKKLISISFALRQTIVDILRQGFNQSH